MRRLLFMLLVVAVWLTPVSAQDDKLGALPLTGPIDSGPFDSPQKAKFTILLGPDFGNVGTPFIDAFVLSQSVSQVGLRLEPKDIAVDLESPLPTYPGPSLCIRVPEATDDVKLEELRKSSLADVIRFGISQVDVQRDAKVEGATFSVRVGYFSGRGEPEWSKYISIANIFSPDAPHIEVFSEAAAASNAANAMGTQDGMYGMGGMGGGGMGGGMGVGVVEPQWAKPNGLVEEFGMLISWSLKDKVVAAINTTTTTDWVRAQLDSDKMTSPIIGSDICVFLTPNTAYGFSTKSNSWSQRKIVWSEDKMPIVTMSSQTATVKTSDDVLVFTLAGRWFSRNSATQTTQPSGMGMGMGMDGSMDMGMGMMDGTPPIAMAQTPLTIAAAQAELERSRDLQNRLFTERVDDLVQRYHAAEDDRTREVIRRSLSLVATGYVTLERKLRHDELRLIQAKIDRLNRELKQLAQPTEEVTEAQVDEWLNRSKDSLAPAER